MDRNETKKKKTSTFNAIVSTSFLRTTFISFRLICISSNIAIIWWRVGRGGVGGKKSSFFFIVTLSRRSHYPSQPRGNLWKVGTSHRKLVRRVIVMRSTIIDHKSIILRTHDERYKSCRCDIMSAT